MVDIVTAVTAAIAAGKKAKEAIEQLENAEVKMQIAELMSALADVKIAAAESREEISTLAAMLKAKQEMVYTGRHYETYDDKGVLTGAYCPRCFDVDDLQVRLPPASQRGTRRCKNCDKLS